MRVIRPVSSLQSGPGGTGADEPVAAADAGEGSHHKELEVRRTTFRTGQRFASEPGQARRAMAAAAACGINRLKADRQLSAIFGLSGSASAVSEFGHVLPLSLAVLRSALRPIQMFAEGSGWPGTTGANKSP